MITDSVLTSVFGKTGPSASVLPALIPLLAAVLFLLLLRKKEDPNAPGLPFLRGAVMLCGLCALLEAGAALSGSRLYTGGGVPALLVSSLVILGMQAVFVLALRYMLLSSDPSSPLLKRPALLWVPWLICLVLLIINFFTGFIMTSSSILYQLEQGPCYFLLYLLLLFALGPLLVLLWRNSRPLALSVAFMVIIRIFFASFMTGLPVMILISVFILILSRASLRQHSLMLEVGVLQLLLTVSLLLVSIGFITNTAISSNLLSTEVKLEVSLDTLSGRIRDTKSLPWLLEYWDQHAEAVVRPDENSFREFLSEGEECESYDEAIILLGEIFREEFTEYTVEEVQALSPLYQYTFARSMYNLLEYLCAVARDEAGVSDVYLLRPRENGYSFVLKDTAGSAASLLPGMLFPAQEVQQTTDRFRKATTSDGLSWAFLGYTDDTSFGITSDLPYGEESTLVCLSIIPGPYVIYAIDNTTRSRLQLTASVVLLMIFVILTLSRNVALPLRKIDRTVRGYQKEKDPEAVRKALAPVTQHNEIGHLARSFTDLTREMELHIQDVTRLAGERERLNAELGLAASIQRNALSTDFPDEERFSLWASMEPARDIGGDFYDFFMIDDRHLALVIADVSDKGVPAALFMMSSKIMINDQAEGGGSLSPAEILSAVNARLSRTKSSRMFVTVWLAILDLETGILRHASAGHEYPVLRQNGRFAVYKDRHGLVLGGVKKARYKDDELTLAPGDAVFVYTDGLAEAHNPDGEFFGLQRIEDGLNLSSPQASPRELVESMNARVLSFCDSREQFDDLTMLCLAYKGPSGAPEPVGAPSSDPA